MTISVMTISVIRRNTHDYISDDYISDPREYSRATLRAHVPRLRRVNQSRAPQQPGSSTCRAPQHIGNRSKPVIIDIVIGCCRQSVQAMLASLLQSSLMRVSALITKQAVHRNPGVSDGDYISDDWLT